MRKRKMTHSSFSYHSDTEIDGEEEDDGEWEPEQDDNVRIPAPPSGEITTPTAAVYRSICKSYAAKRCAIKYNVPPEFEICAPTADQRAHAPPPGYAAIYTQHFRYGLRLPLPPFVVSLLAHYEISLAQLYPVSIIPILGFMEICKMASISPTSTLFRRFFRLKAIRQHTEGWYSFCPIPPKIVFWKKPTNVKGWKSAFLFFKTAPIPENVTLSWNHSHIVDPPLAENEKSSEQIVSRFRASAERYSKARRPYNKRKRADVEKEEERMIDLDVPIASLRKSHRAACRTKNQSAKALRVNNKKKCLDGSSQVLSVPSFQHISPEQSATENVLTLIPCVTMKPKTTSTELPTARDIQKCVCSSNLHKEKLEKVVAALEQDVKDKDDEISSLKAEVSRLKDSEIASLQGEKEELEQSPKDKDSLIASLEGEKKELEKGMVAMEQGLKDKVNKVCLLQGNRDRDRDREKFVKVVAAMVQGIKEKVSEIAFPQHAN